MARSTESTSWGNSLESIRCLAIPTHLGIGVSFVTIWLLRRILAFWVGVSRVLSLGVVRLVHLRSPHWNGVGSIVGLVCHWSLVRVDGFVSGS